MFFSYSTAVFFDIERKKFLAGDMNKYRAGRLQARIKGSLSLPPLGSFAGYLWHSGGGARTMRERERTRSHFLLLFLTGGGGGP